MSNVSKSYEAGSDFTGKNHCFVKFDVNGNITPCGAGDASIGILQDSSPKIGESGPVTLQGVCKVKLGGSVTAGGFVKSGANGVAVASAVSDTFIGAQSLQSGSSGDIIDCRFVGATIIPSPATGASGTITDANAKVVTIVNGIITTIV